MPIYLDYNASAPLSNSVKEVMVKSLELTGNPSSLGLEGSALRDAIETSRMNIANLINVPPLHIIFTSGATESNNICITSVFEQFCTRFIPHFITTAIEHKSVLCSFRNLERKGAKVTYLSVDKNGMINLDELASEITPQTVLCSIIAVNNETGVIQNLSDISDILVSKNVLFHTDATQGLGKVPLNFRKTKVDFASFSAHKISGPKGTGALYIKNYKSFQNYMTFGGAQENNKRPGTENVSGIIGFGEACRISKKFFIQNIDFSLSTKKSIIDHFLSKGFKINSNVNNASPYCISFIVPGLDSRDFTIRYKNKYTLGTGSACNTHDKSPSHVLTALGLTPGECNSTIRLSFGPDLNKDEILKAVYQISDDIDNTIQ